MGGSTSTTQYGHHHLATVVFRSARSVHIDLSGDLDATGVASLKPILDESDRQRPYEVVVNLAGMTSIDRVGADVLMEAAKTLQGHGSTFVIRSPNVPARAMFRRLEFEKFALIEE